MRRLVDTSEHFTDVRVMQTGLSMVATYPLNDDFNVYGRLGDNHLLYRLNKSVIFTLYRIALKRPIIKMRDLATARFLSAC